MDQTNYKDDLPNDTNDWGECSLCGKDLWLDDNGQDYYIISENGHECLLCFRCHNIEEGE